MKGLLSIILLISISTFSLAQKINEPFLQESLFLASNSLSHKDSFNRSGLMPKNPVETLKVGLKESGSSPHERDTSNVDSVTTYYTADLVCSTSFYKNELPFGKWSSYYENGEKWVELEWYENTLPKAATIYFRNGNIAVEKKYTYVNEEIEIKISSWYENGAKFERYKLYSPIDSYQKHCSEDGLEFILNVKPHLGVLASREGKLSGYYHRWFNTGRKWMFMEFDEDVLLEVLGQFTPSNESIQTTFINGTGTVVHFHHLKDTAAVVQYENGLKHGTFKLFHSGNNTFTKGAYRFGNPEGLWQIKSFSGKLKETILYKKSEVAQYSIYGPKSKIYRTYNFKNGYPDGMAVEYDFYRDTAAVFYFHNGLLHGEFTGYLNGAVTRQGHYSHGEQTGDWLTSGQFNDVSHVTSFGQKKVTYNEFFIPVQNFTISPIIDIPQLIQTQILPPKTNNLHTEIFTKHEFVYMLLDPFDYDDLWGSFTFKLLISSSGRISHVNLIHAASEKGYDIAERLSNNEVYFNPKTVFGFPDNSTIYIKSLLFRGR